jgi:hypothetical protein
MEAKEMTPGTLLRRRFGWRLAPLVLCLAGTSACSYSIRSGPSLSVGGIFPRPATTVNVVNNTSCDARVKLVGEEQVAVLAPGGTASFRFYGACDEFVIVASASCGRQNIGAVSAKGTDRDHNAGGVTRARRCARRFARSCGGARRAAGSVAFL